MKEENLSKRIFMKPGRTNEEDRINFIRFWAEYILNHTDKEWSAQQNILINSQIKARTKGNLKATGQDL